MKRIYILFLLAASLCISCKEEEPTNWQLTGTDINFYLPNTTSSDYLDDALTTSGAYNTYANNTVTAGSTAELNLTRNIEVSFEQMGDASVDGGKITITATVTDGDQIEFPYLEFEAEPGEGILRNLYGCFDLVPRGYYVTWEMGFDYDNCDFGPGLDERMTRTITIDNRYTPASFNITTDQWNSMSATYYGPWSNAKLKFMYETFVAGLTRYGPTTYNWPGSYIYATSATSVRTYASYNVPDLNAVLDDYKANSASDPVAYPPILDDNRNNAGYGEWIYFP